MSDLGPGHMPTAGLVREEPALRRRAPEPDLGPGRGLWRNVQRRAGELFVADGPRPAIRQGWLWVVLIVVGGALVSLGRVARGPGVLNTIWAEDGSDLLTDALNRTTLITITRPHNGYFVLLPRLLAEPASLVPIKLGPAVLTIEAALVTALMAIVVYVASRAHLTHTLSRLVAAVPVVAAPVADNSAAAVSNNVATLQFTALYTALWMLLWVPSRPLHRILAAGVVVVTALSTFLAAALIPLALLRLSVRRDRTSALMAGGLLFGLFLNIAALVTGRTARPVILEPRYEPLWALRSFVDWALPHSLFGYGTSGAGAQAVSPAWLVWPALLIVLAAVTLAALRWTRPAWALAAVMFIHAVVLVTGPIMSFGGLELRYAVGPELMLYAGLAALLLPRLDRTDWPRWRVWAPTATVSLLVLLAVATSYQSGSARETLAAWDLAVDRAQTVCQDRRYSAVYIYTWSKPGVPEPVFVGTALPQRVPPPYGAPVRVPCHRLR